MTTAKTAYAAGTYGLAPWSLRGFSHRARFAVAASLAYGDVLDYGCADGHFSEVSNANVTNYEPGDYYRPKPPYLKSLSGVAQRFDCVTCLEVLEHVTDEKVDEFIDDVHRLLKPGGRAIVSVPMMLGPVGALKLAKYLRRGDEGHSFVNLCRHLVGVVPPRVLRGGVEYDHLGFDYRVLRTKIKGAFRTVEQINCPFPRLPAAFNSQVFFLCRR